MQHLHNHIGENSALVAMLAAMLQGIPYSLTIHGPSEFDRPTLLALDEKIRRAAFVVAISEFTRSQLYRWVDYDDWSRIHVIYVGVGPAFLEHGPTPIPSAPRLVSIGRIAEQKGQAILIQAAARLRDRGHDFELVIVGDGPMRGEIEKLIDRFDLQRSGSDHRLPGRPGGHSGAARRTGAGLAQLRRRAAGGDSSRHCRWAVPSSALTSPAPRVDRARASTAG